MIPVSTAVHVLGTGLPRGPVGRFQRHLQVQAGGRKQRHGRQHLPHRDRLDIGRPYLPHFIGSQDAILARRKRGILLVDLIPDRLVHSERVARSRREQVDQQEMDAVPHEFDRLVEKIPERGTAVLVARG